MQCYGACKEVKASQAAYRSTHREKRLAAGKTYRATHKEEQAAASRAYAATHKEERRIRSAAYRSTHGEEERARKAAWYATHREEELARGRLRYIAYREERGIRPRPRRTREEESRVRNAANREVNATLKLAAYNAYGGPRCVCCGEGLLEGLSIDHVNGDGAAHRRTNGNKSGVALYRWLKQQGYPPGFQVL